MPFELFAWRRLTGSRASWSRARQSTLDSWEIVKHGVLSTRAAVPCRVNCSVVDNYLNGIDYAIIGLYLAVLVVLGLAAESRASAGLEQYLLGNRSMPWWMLGLSGVMDFWDLAGTMIIVSFLFLLGPRGLVHRISRRGRAGARRRKCSGPASGIGARAVSPAAEWMLFRFGDGPAGQAAQLARAVAGIVLTAGYDCVPGERRRAVPVDVPAVFAGPVRARRRGERDGLLDVLRLLRRGDHPHAAVGDRAGRDGGDRRAEPQASRAIWRRSPRWPSK